MILKIKTYFTIFTLYEICAVLLLHSEECCDLTFGTLFCDDKIFKYFVMCFAVPAIIYLIVMWISEIVRRVRRHNSIMYRAKSAIKDIVSNVRSKVFKNVSPEDFEKIIAASLLAGLKRYSDRHPTSKKDIEDFIDSEVDDFDDYYYDDYCVKKPKSVNKKKK